MTDLPVVIGLSEHDALKRLSAAGFPAVDLFVSGRRREGSRRVIRQRATSGRVELVVSYFKELDSQSGGTL